MHRELALSLVDDLKVALPVPSETCPVIDKVIKKLKSIRASFPMINKDVLALMECIDMMEELRQDNHTLRELGREWHKLADDLAHQFDHKVEEESE